MLTDTAVKRAPRKTTPYRLKDGRGLYLLVNPNGSKWWRFGYAFSGKRNTLSFGTYPDVPITLARDRREETRALIAAGIDPSAQRKADRTASMERGANSFETADARSRVRRSSDQTIGLRGAVDAHSEPARIGSVCGLISL